MAYEVTYTHCSEQPITVAFPGKDGCPFIPQSNYTYGSRARIDVCTSINHAVYTTYCTLVGAHPSIYPGASNNAFNVAVDLMDNLLRSIGYMGTSREDNL